MSFNIFQTSPHTHSHQNMFIFKSRAYLCCLSSLNYYKNRLPDRPAKFRPHLPTPSIPRKLRARLRLRSSKSGVNFLMSVIGSSPRTKPRLDHEIIEFYNDNAENVDFASLYEKSLPQSDFGFSTASGRRVHVSEKSLSYIRNLLREEMDEMEPMNCDSLDVLEQEAVIQCKMAAPVEFLPFQLSHSSSFTTKFYYDTVQHLHCPSPVTCLSGGKPIFVVYPNECGRVGLTEVKRAFLSVEGVDPRRANDSFVSRHFRHVVSKERFQSGVTPRLVADVVVQLHGRYHREIVLGRRSALGCLDNHPNAVVVVILCRTAGEGLVEVSDGWVTLCVTADEGLEGKVGFKLTTTLFSERHLYHNCTRSVDGKRKLGFAADQAPLGVSIGELRVGMFGSVTGLVVSYYQIESDFSHVLRLGDGSHSVIARLGESVDIRQGDRISIIHGLVVSVDFGVEIRSVRQTRVLVRERRGERMPLTITNCRSCQFEFDGVFVVTAYDNGRISVVDQYNDAMVVVDTAHRSLSLVPRQPYVFLNLRRWKDCVCVTEFTAVSQVCPNDSFRVLYDKLWEAYQECVVERPRKRRSYFGFADKTNDNWTFHA